MISNSKILNNIKTELHQSFNPVLGISITRYSTSFEALSNKEFGVDGIWVFISGAENSWSLNHKEYENCKWFGANVSGDITVYDFQGNKTTPKDVYLSSILRLLTRNHFVLDHEDAGFFIPISEFRHIKNIHEIELFLKR